MNDIQKVVSDRTLPTGYYKAILITLLSLGNNVKMTQQELMKNTGIGSRNTLVSNTQVLENLGWLKVTHTRDEYNRFDINEYEVIVK